MPSSTANEATATVRLADLPAEVIERIAGLLPTPRDLAAANATSRLFRGAPGGRSAVEHALRERARARGHDRVLPAELPAGMCTCAEELFACECVLACARVHAAVVAAGGGFSAFVDAEGGLHTCGEYEVEDEDGNGTGEYLMPSAVGHPDVPAVSRPSRVASLSAVRVRSVAAGGRHLLALSDAGAVYGCGENFSGQLGLGDDDERHAFVHVQALVGEAIVCIAAGGGHSLALTVAGCAYSWGANPFGQLGHGDTEARWEPTRIEALDGVRVGTVSAGVLHTLLLSPRWAVYSCGHGECGALGHGDEQDQLTPRRIEALAGVRTVHVSAGGDHSLVVDAAGGVHSFGYGRSGQLGHGNDITQWVPMPIAALASLRAVRACAGSFSSAVLGADGSVHTFGNNEYGQLGYEGGLHAAPGRVAIPSHHPAAECALAWNGLHALCVTADGAAYSCGKQSAALGLGVSAADGAGRLHSLTRIEQLPRVHATGGCSQEGGV